MPSRSSRSSPHSFTSPSDPPGSATRAVAIPEPNCTPPLSSCNVGKAADWLREERRKVLGDWAAFCLSCGGALRWFEAHEDEVPAVCPTCAGALLHRCPSCDAPFSSAFAVDCESCGKPLREGELLGLKIRRV